MSEAAPSNNVIQEYFINIFRYKYIQYNGRARRKEFWMFALFSFICSLVLNIIPFLGLLYSLAAIVPGTCLGIRRMHDIGKSGWWLLLALIPFVGIIVLIVFYCLDSQPGENQYGPNPKGA
jgi:uncharacterized membrane protein YhaH (DUF805 family)